MGGAIFRLVFSAFWSSVGFTLGQEAIKVVRSAWEELHVNDKIIEGRDLAEQKLEEWADRYYTIRKDTEVTD